LAGRWLRPAAAAACAALAGLLAMGGPSPVDGGLFDLAAALRARLAPAPPPPPAAVVALDRSSLAAPELAPLPRTFLGPRWAELIDALAAAEARAVGFDIVFAYSANRFAPNHDAPFFAALHRHRDRVALGRSAGTPLAAPLPFIMPPEAIGLIELPRDPDGAFRRVPGRLAVEGGPPRPGLAAATLGRAGLAMPDEVPVAPRGPLESWLPTYALIDVLRCAGREPDSLRRAFAGRFVLVGTTLPEEDRKAAPDRLMPSPAPSPAPAGCLRPLGPSDPGADTVPGVHLHAAAVAAVAAGEAVAPLPPALAPPLAALAAALGCAAGLRLRPWRALLAVGALAAALVLAAAGLLAAGLWLPLGWAVLAGPAAAALAYAARWVLADRRGSRLQHAFGHYLAPGLVAEMAEGDGGLSLGGRQGEVTVMFADLSGFTALSETLPADALMAVTNRYLGAIGAAVAAEGGYVDKFIGDAVMALWGAPLPQPDHAPRAARAALDAVARIAAMQAADAGGGGPGFAVKIGLNSGPAVVGNVGWPGRYNYTAVGETVNLASRCEGLPGDYGCAVVLAEGTAERLGGAVFAMELDRVRVKGKRRPVAVFEPLAAGADPPPDIRAYAEGYGAALTLYRAGRFAEAAAAWRGLERPASLPQPGPQAAMAGRAAAYAADPPAEWDGIHRKLGK